MRITFIKKLFFILTILSTTKGISQSEVLNRLIDSCQNGVAENKLKHATNAIDIINNLLSKAPKDTSLIYKKGIANHTIGIHYYDLQEFEESNVYLTKAINPFKKLKKVKKLAATYGQLGINWYLLGDNSTALDYYNKELSLYEDESSIANCALNIGIIHYTNGDIKKGLELFFKNLKFSEKIQDSSSISYVQNLIGNAYYIIGDTSQSETYFKQSLAIRLNMNDLYGIAESYNSLGTFYYELQLNDTALSYYNRSLKIREDIGDKQGIGELLANMGVLFLNTKEFRLAEDHFNKAYQIFTEIDLAQGQALVLYNLGELYTKTNQLEKAENTYKKSLKLSKKLGYPDDIKDAANELSQLYRRNNKFEKALDMYVLYIKMRDSINSQDYKNAAIEQQIKYEYEKQKTIDDYQHEKDIAIETANHEKEMAIKQEEKEKKNVIIYAISAGLILLFGFMFFIFNRLRVTKKQKNEIGLQKHKIEEAHNELEEKNKEVLDSINYAKRIQSAILPPSKLVKEYLQKSFILYKPKDIVAGDFYWMEHKEGEVLFAAADCTGHGVPGAMVSVVCNNALNRSVREYDLTEPGEILDKTREIVISEFDKSEEDVKDGMDIALCSLEGNKLKYAGANNPLWIIRNGSNTIEETKANKQPIGKFDLTTPYTTHIFELQKGDSVYIFSDGFVDQFGGPKGKKFKAKAFRELLLSIQNIPMEEQSFPVDEAFEKWKGGMEQIDDVCVIGIRM